MEIKVVKYQLYFNIVVYSTLTSYNTLGSLWSAVIHSLPDCNEKMSVKLRLSLYL
jgi:hypothetical protein